MNTHDETILMDSGLSLSIIPPNILHPYYHFVLPPPPFLLPNTIDWRKSRYRSSRWTLTAWIYWCWHCGH